MPSILNAKESSATPKVNPRQRAPQPVAQLILEQLKLWGVQRIYGVVGDTIFGLMDALAKQNAISFIAVKHESVAAMMASAEAKLTGKLGVCIAHMGPGLANLINGLGDAFLDKAPVLAITGQAPLGKIGTAYKQYINQQQMVHAVSPCSLLVVHPDAVVESLTQAMHTSVLHRTVSHLSIPLDLFGMTTAMQPSEPLYLPASVPNSSDLREALHLILSAQKPMILAGGGARSARESIQALADHWGCGIAMSYGAIGIIDDTHPLLLNGLGEGGNPYLAALFRKADVVLVLETSWWPEGMVPGTAKVIRVAKHQADLGTAPADIRLAQDTASIIPQWIEGLKSYKPSSDWIYEVQQCKLKWAAQNENEKGQSGSPLSPSSIIGFMERYIAEDAVIALDEGDCTLWFMRNFRAKHQHILYSEWWRTMGFGLPAAMAGQLCMPQKQVVCVTGDGGLGMVLADLTTAARYGLPVTVIVLNNGTLQMERDKMIMKGLKPEGTELTNPDFAKIAEACGWIAYRIENGEQLEKAWNQSRTSNNPVLLDVLTAPIPHPDFKSN
ncbi:thiamine pyrophosphate-binding protein [Paenibacillus ginsengarvi]|uniref:Thiamine pyrophosphate-binding protein n=1 Tax=Paenibacillus ginsengarvi TaxID=400777 RepID=A0A3B0CLI8_9BACL|nr:thiamine pyrophosphate-binding protein [Paenibacillus ginsengarvi]RKN85608.1 thiamine pyrophosphate-binding protein [Paenibacillus ginsengarvi]